MFVTRRRPQNKELIFSYYVLDGIFYSCDVRVHRVMRLSHIIIFFEITNQKYNHTKGKHDNIHINDQDSRLEQKSQICALMGKQK